MGEVQRVLGIGGLFFRATDPSALAAAPVVQPDVPIGTLGQRTLVTLGPLWARPWGS